jgi:NAD+ diphosphatase
MTAQDVPQPALMQAWPDRAAAERDEPELLERLRADPGTRVLGVHGDRITVLSDAALHLASPATVDEAARWAFLGRDEDGAAVLLAAAGTDAQPPVADAEWAPLRRVAATLGAAEAALAVTAVSLARWLVDAPFCPACGAQTVPTQAGWSRSCPSCGRQHFPRTDPAVIVAVTSADGERLLLGRNALWGERVLYSAFAGFVEAGESLEEAIVREVQEEAGVTVEALRYHGSQAWPYPRSLMLGFHAVAADEEVARADGTEIVDVRWFDRAELGAALAGAGDVELPGPASIAHALLVRWVGA